MSKTVNTNSDFGYLNILLNNSSDEIIESSYNETQSQPILTQMQDFNLAIVRLKIPTTAIPLMVFEDNAYFIGFSLGDNDTNLLIEDVNYDIYVNGSNASPQNRFIYYYNQFLTCVNNALARLWTTALATPAYATIIPAPSYIDVNRPKFRLSPQETYIELLVPFKDSENPATPFYPKNPNGINILMSKKLFYFFSGFSAGISLTGGFGGDPRMSYKLQIGNYLNGESNIATLPYPPLPSLTYNIVSQDYPSLFLWQTLTRIIITTTIPIETETILIKGQDGKPNKQSILTDFEISQTQLGLREYIYFYPQGELRRNNFKSTGWLDRFDCKVWFQTKDLSIYPVYIPPTFECNIKIEFKRRKAKELLQYTQDTTKLTYF